MISGNSDFIALCRKIVSIYFGKAYVKVLDINAMADCTEVQTEIETAKWEDSVLFRFYRTTGAVGELFVRTRGGERNGKFLRYVRIVFFAVSFCIFIWLLCNKELFHWNFDIV